MDHNLVLQVLQCKSKSFIRDYRMYFNSGIRWINRDYRMDLIMDYNMDYSSGIGITIWIIILE